MKILRILFETPKSPEVAFVVRAISTVAFSFVVSDSMDVSFWLLSGVFVAISIHLYFHEKKNKKDSAQ